MLFALIGVFYSLSRNLTIPILIHFLNNYLLGLFTVDVKTTLPVFAAAYVIVTGVVLMLYKPNASKRSLRDVRRFTHEIKGENQEKMDFHNG